MATEKWIAGAVATYTAAFGSEINAGSFVNGDSLQSSVVIANATNLDMFMDISVSLASITTAAPNFVGFSIYPLNQDGSTYGDGRFGSLAAGVPAPQLWVGNIIFPVGTQVCVGTLERIVLPPTNFVLVLYNQAGATLASSGNVIKYKTYNRSVA
jgi:hypothetical protein